MIMGFIIDHKVNWQVKGIHSEIVLIKLTIIQKPKCFVNDSVLTLLFYYLSIFYLAALKYVAICHSFFVYKTKALNRILCCAN